MLSILQTRVRTSSWPYAFKLGMCLVTKLSLRFPVDLGYPVAGRPRCLFHLAVRLSETTICADEASIDVKVWRIDCPLGLTGGFQKVVSGFGIVGEPEMTWRGEVAMAYFVCLTLFATYTLVTLPSYVKDVQEIWERSGDDPVAVQLFEALDGDEDGFITQADVFNFVQEHGQGQVMNPEALMQEMDPSGTGRVSYDQFMDWYESAREAIEEGLQQASAGGSFGGSPYPAAGGFGNLGVDGPLGGGIGGLYPGPGSLTGSIGGMQPGRSPPGAAAPRGFPEGGFDFTRR